MFASGQRQRRARPEQDYRDFWKPSPAAVHHCHARTVAAAATASSLPRPGRVDFPDHPRRQARREPLDQGADQLVAPPGMATRRPFMVAWYPTSATARASISGQGGSCECSRG
jgi:hypothetical protein